MMGFRKSHALVIGIDKYGQGIPSLRTAVNDASRIAQILEASYGYSVRLLTEDVSLANLRMAFGDSLQQDVKADDRVLVYFAGHGIALDGDDGPAGYLVPQDASRQHKASFLAMTDLNRWLDKLPCRHLLLVLDCCFAGAYRWSSTRDLGTMPDVIHRERFDRYIKDPAWQVITSAAYDQKALDVLAGEILGSRGADHGTDGHSPFAAAFLRALEKGEADLIPRGGLNRRGGDGVITATELYLFLRECVEVGAEADGHLQTPGLWPLKKHDKGEYIHLVPGHPLNLPPAPALDEANNPWRGLQSYDEEHAYVFFGRSRFVAALADRVRSQPLTVVLGASGTGKSSVVKAGLVSHLRTTEHDSWQMLPPIRPGKSPLASLAGLSLPGEEADDLNAHLAEFRIDPEALAKRVGAWAEREPAGQSLLLVIDQFEELITLCWDVGERDHLMQLLQQALAAHPDRLRVVVTLRSDFEPQYARSPLEGAWMASRIVVPAMTLDEYRETIEGPASVKVLYFKGKTASQEFINRLIGDVANTPGALPLLSFTLSELYRRYLQRGGDDRALCEEDYEALGGVGGSLRNRAEEVYTGLPDDATRESMRRVMLRMISVEAGEVARRHVPDTELVYREPAENARVAEVLRRLTESRLVVEGKETDDEPYVEPAHDELVRGWDRLLNWSRRDQEGLLLRRILTPAAEDWKRGHGGLWHANPRLGLLRRVLRAESSWLNRTETEFVERSVARRLSLRLTAAGFVTAAFVALSMITYYALGQRDTAVARAKDAKRETAHLQTTQGEQSQAAGRLQSALHYYAASLVQRLGIGEDDPTSRLRLGILTGQVPILRAGLAGDDVAETLTFSPDSRRIVTFSDVEGSQVGPSAEIHLWDGDSGRHLVHLKEGTERLQSVKFSPDGRWILVLGRFDNRASLWDAATGKRLHAYDGHTGVVNEASFSPDGLRVVTSSRDGTARVWDRDSGRQLMSLRVKHGYVYTTRYSPDGRVIATATSDGVRLWDASTGALLHDLPAERGYPDIEFSPDGKLLLGQPFNFFINRTPGEGDYLVRLWDVASGRLLNTFDHASSARFVGSAGRIYVHASSFQLSGEIPQFGQLYNIDGFKVLARYEGAVAVGPKGDRLVILNKGSASLIEPREGRVIRILPGEVSKAAFSRDGKSLITDYPDNTARLWDATAGTMITTFEGHTASVTAFAFSDEGGRIATASADRTVRIWEFHPTAETKLRGHVGDVKFAEFGRDDQVAVTASFDPHWTISEPRLDGFVRAWDTQTGRPIAELEGIGVGVFGSPNLKGLVFEASAGRILAQYDLIGNQVHSILRLIDVDNGRIVSEMDGNALLGRCRKAGTFLTEKENTIHAWNFGDGKARFTIQGVLPVRGVGLFSGDRLATIVDDRNDHDFYDLQIWDARTGQAVARVDKFWKKSRSETDGTVYPVSWHLDLMGSPDGRTLVILAGDADDSLIIDLNDARITGRFRVPSFKVEGGAVRGSAVDTATFSPNSRYFISVGNAASVWDATTGRRLGGFEGTFLDWHPHSSQLATLRGGQALIWDLATEGRVATIRSANDAITLAKFDRVGNSLVTGTAAGSVELWDVATATMLTRLGLLESEVSSLAVSSSNRAVLAGSTRGDLRIWPMAPRPIRVDGLPGWILAGTGCELTTAGRVVGIRPGDWVRRRDDIERQYEAAVASGTAETRVTTAAALITIAPANRAAIEALAGALDAPGVLAARAREALALADVHSEAFQRAMLSRVEQGKITPADTRLAVRLGEAGLPVLERLILGTPTMTSRARASLVYSLGSFGRPAVGLLSRASTAPDPAVRVASSQVLGSMGNTALPAAHALVEAIGLDNREARIAAGKALAAIGPAVIPELVKALNRPAHFQRSNALILLRDFGEPAQEAIPSLVPIALAEPDAEIRDRAIEALVAIDSGGESGGLFGQSHSIYGGKRSLVLLEKYLAADQLQSRLQAIQVLAALSGARSFGESPVTPLLGRALSDPAPAVRDVAARALIGIRNDEILKAVDPKAIPSFLKLLHDPDKEVRSHAMMTIWTIGAAVAPWTREILDARQDPESTVSIYASHTLKAIGKAGLPYLGEALKDPSATIRAEAADRLGLLGAEAALAVPWLDPLLDDPESAVRLNAAEAILQIGQASARVEATLIALLQSHMNINQQSRAAAALGKTKRSEGDVVRALGLALDDRSPDIRLRAAESLLKLGVEKDRPISILIALLPPEAGDGNVSSEAAQLLGRLDAEGRPAIPALRHAITAFPKTYNLNLRMSFVRALKNLGALDALIDVLDKESEISFFHEEILKDVGKMLEQHTDRVPRIAELLGHSKAEIRQAAAGLLENLGPAARAALPALEKAKADAVDGVRSAAILAIEAICAEERLDHEDEAARLKAAKTLIARGAATTHVVVVLSRVAKEANDPDVRIEALRELPKVGEARKKASADQLTASLRDPDPLVRYWAADGLLTMNLARDQAVSTLVEVLASDAMGGQVSATAASRLGGLGKGTALPPTVIASIRESFTKFPDYANSFLNALGQLHAVPDLIRLLEGKPSEDLSNSIVYQIETALKGDPAAIAALRPLLDHSNPALRKNAVKLLGRIAGDQAKQLKTLQEALNDSDEGVRQAAREAIAGLKRREAGEDLP